MRRAYLLSVLMVTGCAVNEPAEGADVGAVNADALALSDGGDVLDGQAMTSDALRADALPVLLDAQPRPDARPTLDGQPPAPDGQPRPDAAPGCPDQDEDGHLDEQCGGLDCDDADPMSHPGAVDRCDGRDNNCDGRIDEGDVCCVDADMDGAPAINARCGAGRDCDDANPAVHPSAAEICDDGLDNDCDAAIDLADANCAACALVGQIDPACDDGNTCTEDRCGADGQCETPPVSDGVPCGALYCEGLEHRQRTCLSGGCTGFVAVAVCDDSGSPCQSARCVDATGCTIDEVAGMCDDANDCTLDDRCVEGRCVGTLNDADEDGQPPLSCGGADCCDTGEEADVVGCQASTAAQINSVGREICDGLDANCNGIVNDGVSLPTGGYSAMEYVEEGFFGLPTGAILVWGDTLAFWDTTEGSVTGVAPLGEIWTALSPNGAPPPADQIDGIVSVPAGFMETPADTLFILAGSALFGLNNVDLMWSQSAWEALIPGAPPFISATIIRVGDLGMFNGAPNPGEPMFVLISDEPEGQHFYLWTPTNGLVGPQPLATAFCGGGEPCPRRADSIARLPGSPATIAIYDNVARLLYLSPLNTDPATGELRYTWSASEMSAISCQY